jgi:hypothetical protein
MKGVIPEDFIGNMVFWVDEKNQIPDRSIRG